METKGKKVRSQNGKTLAELAKSIDLAGDSSNASKIDAAHVQASAVEKQRLSAKHRAELNYYIANIWAIKNSLKRRKYKGWENPELEMELVYLRKSADGAGFKFLHPMRRCQVLTNLGSKMTSLGRFSDAISYWNRALEIMDFGMAMGFKGRSLLNYCRHLNSYSQQEKFVEAARGLLEKALESNSTEVEKLELFQKALDSIPKTESVKKKTSKSASSKFGQEAEYRKWCLRNQLYLNYLNDIDLTENAAEDNLGLPPMTTKNLLMPDVVRYFNILKQEYVTARYLFYVGTTTRGTNFSDKNVLIYNTNDYPSYSFYTKSCRLAFRSAYSILDKVSVLIREYYRIKLPMKRTNFRSVWYSKGHQKKGILKKFRTSRNFPLVGLFWLSKEILESDEFKKAISPEAKNLSEIRNYLEHKFLSIHSDGFTKKNKLLDNKAMYISSSDFNEKTLALLKMARQTLLQVSMAINVEELNKKIPGNLTVPMTIDIYSDAWKQNY